MKNAMVVDSDGFTQGTSADTTQGTCTNLATDSSQNDTDIVSEEDGVDDDMVTNDSSTLTKPSKVYLVF